MNTPALFVVLVFVLLACCALPMLFMRKHGSRSHEGDVPRRSPGPRNKDGG